MLADAYRSGRARVVELVEDLPDDRSGRVVPACPDWTVRDLLAHLVGTAADVTARRTSGLAGPDWTAAHVAARRGVDVPTLLAEWDRHVDATADALEDRRVPVTVLGDLLVHEGDLAESLGAPQPPWDGWASTASVLVRQVIKGIRGRETLVVRAGGTEWRSPDDAAPDTVRSVVSVDLYELYRGLQSRRSRDQMRRWDWDGPTDPWIDALPVHGPRDDEQPVPPPR
ncbi:maleylpyruvate isomerase family mycothiol-dependent enzyme [Actinomycetospora termitidis]|uniref:Maleylpyruvate isomerase family mycothiol-dependent enzyme n=1 Tax=Actinomycetospora termitidis TaxID=3053470 RepID=A0ABT7M4J1_9PSEU|nr:maleylpyruvate isomerase family mycothiol-dependent enzyme [Actinomycetospora sp. Odt1-22]MDL5155589.1 maleylpyruvate isomerase family mycothiol-dependent enzyme [Actinomycetospora sp. Odt1-22]